MISSLRNQLESRDQSGKRNQIESPMELTTSWKEEGIQLGLQQGRQEGRQEEAVLIRLRMSRRRLVIL